MHLQNNGTTQLQTGTMELRNQETMELRNYGTTELRNYGTTELYELGNCEEETENLTNNENERQWNIRKRETEYRV